MSKDKSLILKPDGPVSSRLTRAAIEINARPASIKYASFLHAVLCQITFPRKQTDLRTFERQSGNASLLIKAGELWVRGKWVDQPLPYGVLPRLIMTYISTEAIRTQRAEVEIGHSIREFLGRLHLDSNGNTYREFKKQMDAVGACSIQLGFSTYDKDVTIDTKPISIYEQQLAQNGNLQTLWPGRIILSSDYFVSLQKHAVPLDTRALSALQHSALALDIYTWLAYRLHQITKDRGVRISWHALHEQFGPEYKAISKFKQNFKKSLKQVLVEYSQANISVHQEGLVLLPSFPPIHKTQIQVVTAPTLFEVS